MGAFWHDSCCVYQVPPFTLIFKSQHERGRVVHLHVAPSSSSGGFSYYVIYGFINGAKLLFQAVKTNAIISAIIAEMQAHPECPILIAGDLNAEPSDLLAISKFLGEFCFLDLGAVADTFGQPTHQPNCIAPSSLQATRRDFMYASPSLFAAVKILKVFFPK